MNTALEMFRQAYPSFESTILLDTLRTKEYARLDNQGQIYLDYTGGGLYAESQLRAHMELLQHNVFGNPHSISPTSQTTTDLCERARAFVLEYFHASPQEYTVIFTPNASGALKLVGESYPFAPGDHFLLLFDNHNSVNGMREFARAKGALHTYVPIEQPELRVDETHLLRLLDDASPSHHNLFAYPAQSNFTGVQHPLEWCELAQARGWEVLLDCAAFAPTNRFDLSKWHPDFVPISFYKIFGYPTGIGCLLARKAALAKLRRPWFAGGTVWAVTVQSDVHYLLEGGAAFEDGTLNYLLLPAVEIGIKYIQNIGMETIHTRVMCLTSWLIDHLLLLRHSNGQAVVEIYGPRHCHMRGGTLAVNVLTPDGSIIDERIIDRKANAFRLSLRTGCFCNPGAGEGAFNLARQALLTNFSEKTARPSLTMDEYLALMGLHSAGAARISLGLASNFADIYRCMQFFESFVDYVPDEKDLPIREHC
jgi:selenocysteine lyase/cysteine desulfurase